MSTSDARPEGPRAQAILVIRPVLKIAGGTIHLAWWDGAEAEEPCGSLPVDGEPDHDWPGLAIEVETALKAGCRRFILDLDRVPWMNSRGLGRLVALWRSLDGAGARLVVVCASDRIANILRISQLDEILRPFPTLADASREFPARS